MPDRGDDSLMASKEWRLLSEDERLFARRLVAALGFEPYPLFFEGADGVLEKLVAKGLAEAGPSLRPAVAATGYRLSEKGWALVSANWAIGVPPGSKARTESARPNGHKPAAGPRGPASPRARPPIPEPCASGPRR